MRNFYYSKIKNIKWEFEEKVDIVSLFENKKNTYDVVKNYVDNKLGKFTSKDVIEYCPLYSRSSILSSLKRLSEEEYIVKKGENKKVFYVKNDEF